MKKYVLSAVILILAGIAGAGWYVYRNAEELGFIHPQLIPPDYYWLNDPSDIYGETGIVEIAGREFKIPIAYVDGRFKNGRKRDSVVLEYVLPDFRSKLEFGNKKERMKIIQAGRMAGMLLEESAVRPSFDVMIENHRTWGNDSVGKFQEKIYGLEKYIAPKPEGKYARKPDDTFLEKDSSGKIISFLRCSSPGEDKVPLCNHKFRDKGLLYEIYYGIKMLPEWEQRRQATINFIDSFEIKPDQPEKEDKHVPNPARN